MKFFIKLILVFAVILGLFLAFISTKPKNYDVYHTQVLKANIDDVFKTVNDYKTWESWGPWIEMDTTIVVKLDEKTSGVGSGYSWSSEKDENGRMETLTLEKNKYITQKVIFGNKGDSDIYWKFKSVDEGTEVTWGMKSDLGLIERAAFFVIGGAELMFKPMLVKGLRNLDKFTQKIKKSDKYSITSKGVVTSGGNYYVGLKAECSFDELGATLDKILPEVLIYCMQNDIKKEGKIFNLYHKYDEKNKHVEVSSCIPVKAKVKVDKKYDVNILKKGKYHKTILQGNYTHSDEAWGKAFEFIAKENLVIDDNEKPFEVFVKGHTQSPNPEDWVTEIYFPIK